MAKVLTVSRQFPAYHPRKGEPTYFVEKVLTALFPKTTYYMCKCENCGWQGMSCCAAGGHAIADTGDYSDAVCPKCYSYKIEGECEDLDYYQQKDEVWPKYHTIRAGKRWNTGDMVSLRAWSGQPYNSKQIIIAPDFALPKVLDVKMYYSEKWGGGLTIAIGEYEIEYPYGCKEWLSFSKNDGLELLDMKLWFELSPDFKKTKQFDGQMIFFTDTPTPY
jgi:hypothetical protein